MGVFYYIGAVALTEDIPTVEFKGDLNQFYAEVDKGFHQVKFLVILELSLSRG